MGKWIYKTIKYYLECLLDILFPEPLTCSVCNRFMKEYNKYLLCNACVKDIEFTSQKAINLNSLVDKHIKNNEMSHSNIKVISPCVYVGKVREMVHRLKYKDRMEIAKTAAEYIGDALKDIEAKNNIIIPVPIHRLRLKKRGYNQAYIIAKELGSIKHIKVLQPLIRKEKTKEQVSLNNKDRWLNVKDVFYCNTDMKGKKVILIDDVITTGATAYYCSLALKKAGAEEILIATFARTEEKI